jgi:hypothetical protein
MRNPDALGAIALFLSLFIATPLIAVIGWFLAKFAHKKFVQDWTGDEFPVQHRSDGSPCPKCGLRHLP